MTEAWYGATVGLVTKEDGTYQTFGCFQHRGDGEASAVYGVRRTAGPSSSRCLLLVHPDVCCCCQMKMSIFEPPFKASLEASVTPGITIGGPGTGSGLWSWRNHISGFVRSSCQQDLLLIGFDLINHYFCQYFSRSYFGCCSSFPLVN